MSTVDLLDKHILCKHCPLIESQLDLKKRILCVL